MSTTNSSPKPIKTTSDNPHAGFSKYLEATFNSPKYLKGDATFQRQVREYVYDKKVVPYYTAHGSKAPDREAWVFNKAYGYKPQPTSKESTFDDISRAALAKSSHLAETAIDVPMFFAKGYYQAAIALGFKKAENERSLKHLTDTQQKMKDVAHLKNSQGYWGESAERHYDGSLRQAVAGMVGESIPLLPLYHVTAEVSAGMPMVSNSPLGQFIQKRLTDAAEGFLYGKLDGGTNREAGKTARDFAVINPILNGELLKFFGKIVGIGGTKYAEANLKKAVEVMEKEHLSTNVPSEKSVSPKVAEDIKVETPAGGTGDVAVKDPSPSVETTSIKDPVIQAHIEALNEIAKAKFSKVNYNFLTPIEKIKALHEAGIAIGHAAGQVVEHNPELVAAEAERTVQNLVQRDPATGKFVAVVKQATGKTTGRLVADNIKENAKAEAELDAKIAQAKKDFEAEKFVKAITSGDAPSTTTNKIVPGAARGKSLEFISGILDWWKREGLKDVRVEGEPNKLLILLHGLQNKLVKLPEGVNRKVAEELLIQHLKSEPEFAKLSKVKLLAKAETALGKIMMIKHGFAVGEESITKHGKTLFASTGMERGKKFDEDVVEFFNNLVNRRDSDFKAEVRRPGPGAANVFDASFLRGRNGPIHVQPLTSGGANWKPDPSVSAVARELNNPKGIAYRFPEKTYELHTQAREALANWQWDGGYNRPLGKDARDYITSPSMYERGYVDPKAKLIVDLIRNSEDRSGVLFRGIKSQGKEHSVYEKLVKGDHLIIEGPSSFSRVKDKANDFSFQGKEFDWDKMVPKEGGTKGYMFVIQGKYKGVDVQLGGDLDKEAEILTHGRFEVTGVTNNKYEQKVIQLRQLEVF